MLLGRKVNQVVEAASCNKLIQVREVRSSADRRTSWVFPFQSSTWSGRKLQNTATAQNHNVFWKLHPGADAPRTERYQPPGVKAWKNVFEEDRLSDQASATSMSLLLCQVLQCPITGECFPVAKSSSQLARSMSMKLHPGDAAAEDVST